MSPVEEIVPAGHPWKRCSVPQEPCHVPGGADHAAEQAAHADALWGVTRNVARLLLPAVLAEVLAEDDCSLPCSFAVRPSCPPPWPRQIGGARERGHRGWG